LIPQKNYQMNWRLVAIPVTLIPILIIAIQFDIKLDDVLAIGFFHLLVQLL
jgi:hypothetical protein